jgi:Leucine-rich repeat (LRR) protein
MAGVAAVIGGAFVSAIIRSVVDTGRSHFADKYKEHKDTQKMLDSLEASLPQILSVIELAEQSPIVQDASLVEWLQQLKDVAYEAEDVMDDFEAKRIREILENKGKVSEIATSFAGAVRSLFLSDKDEKKLKYILHRMENVSQRLGNFINVMNSRNTAATEGPSRSIIISETSSHLPKSKKIFGRDKDIDLILDMILGAYHDNQSNLSNQVKQNFMQNIRKFITKSLRKINTIVSKRERDETESSNDDIYETESSNDDIFSLTNVGNMWTHQSDATDNTWTTPHIIDATISVCVGNRVLDVLPIVGIGGVGKTTVAQAIYNHLRVQEYFELRGWIYVMDSADYKSLVNDIVLSFEVGTSRSTESIHSLNEGECRLRSAIKNRRFLLIFDDVREGIDLTWKRLLPVLAEGALGSIILVTTQWQSVASKIGTLPTIFLDVLEPHHFLALFEYHAFGHFNYTHATGNQNFLLSPYEETELKPIGEEIAQKLHCLPLAAETVGTLLSKHLDKNYWEKILTSHWWKLKIVLNNVVRSLGVSFQNLDPDLKQCFIYCSLFPNNYLFDKNRLIQMWIAHGFIHPTKIEQFLLEREEIKMEDIGVSRFDKLVDRFFFQTTIWENRYVMHDLIRELGIAVSSKEVLYVDTKDLKDTGRVPFFPRHLAIDADFDDDFYVDRLQWGEKNMEGLRTIMFFGCCKLTKDKAIHDILYKLTGLRLLDLSYFRNTSFSLPDKVIRQLPHIRFLDLSFSGITSIPNSIFQLVHLQVLNIRGCWFSQLPDEMNRLINLRHLYASPDTISLISGIGKLTKLQELEEFDVSMKTGFTISELMDMDFLSGQLTLGSLEKVLSKNEAISAKLDKKRYLTSLLLRYCNTPSNNTKHMEILEGLKPHKNVRELSIQRFMSVSFPSWMMELHEINNLRSIKLTQCYYLETLPPLGSLPKLEVLIMEDLRSIIYLGHEFYGISNVIFPSLKELTICDLSEWKHWSDPSERQLFPCLQKLKIKNCYQLSEAPLHCLNSSVVELYLSNCDQVIKNVEKYFEAMTSLTQLYLHGYDWLKLDLFCDHLHELRVLTLKKIVIPHLEEQISFLVNLKKLSFSSCSHQWEISNGRQQLQAVLPAQSMHILPSLACIEVHHCSEIPKFLFRLRRLPSLRTLWIDDCTHEYIFTSEQDSWVQTGLTSLEEMKLSNCENLRRLPLCFSTLPSLKKFTLEACRMISSLPQEGLPRSLKELYISQCSVTLMRGCEPDKGAEWPKISHIPYIRVGKQTVQHYGPLPQ